MHLARRLFGTSVGTEHCVLPGGVDTDASIVRYEPSERVRAFLASDASSPAPGGPRGWATLNLFDLNCLLSRAEALGDRTAVEEILRNAMQRLEFATVSDPHPSALTTDDALLLYALYHAMLPRRVQLHFRDSLLAALVFEMATLAPHALHTLRDYVAQVERAGDALRAAGNDARARRTAQQQLAGLHEAMQDYYLNYARPTPPSTLQDVFRTLPVRNLRGQQPDSLRIADRVVPVPRGDAFRPAYVAVTRPLYRNDDPLKQKIGGHRPYFRRGDRWPTTDDLASDKDAAVRQPARPLAFVMQFTDPRPRLQQRLVQVFFQDIDAPGNLGNGERIYMRVIENLDTEPYETPAPVAEPPDVIENQHVYDEPQEIIGWTLRDEPPEDYVRTLLQRDAGLSEDARITLQDQVYDAIVPGGRAQGIKIGGYGESTQSVEYALFIHNLYTNEWGDGGVLHVSDDAQTFGDMG